MGVLIIAGMDNGLCQTPPPMQDPMFVSGGAIGMDPNMIQPPPMMMGDPIPMQQQQPMMDSSGMMPQQPLPPAEPMMQPMMTFDPM